jgi:hypothetical protein
MHIFYPPNAYPSFPNKKYLFLAGSIEMGKATDWQKEVSEKLADLDIVILNPRRPDWDSSWVQSVENEEFVKQVEWELEGLEKADLIIMYFAANTYSPISLLELGLHAREKKVIVYCEPTFWRKGNVDVVCRKYGVKQANSWEELLEEVKKM